MAFSVRSNSGAGNAADNWSKGVQASGSKLAQGYAAPRRDPQANAATSANRWSDAVAEAKGTYQSRLAGYDSGKAIATMQSVGQQRYTQAGTAKKDNYAKVATDLIPALRSAPLPADRSTPGARDARMLAQVAYARTLKGKYRK